MLLNVKCKVKFVIKIPHKKKSPNYQHWKLEETTPQLCLPSDIQVTQPPGSSSISDNLFIKFPEEENRHSATLITLVSVKVQSGVLFCFGFR